MPSKEECKRALENMRVPIDIETEWYSVDILNEVIDEHFKLVEKHENLKEKCKELSNSNDILRRQLYFIEPYKFEDLKPNLWVWDDKEKVCYQIGIDEDTKEWVYYCFGDGLFDTQFAYPLEFEESRFYPVQMANLES